MSAVFLKLLNMSIAAGWLVVAVIVLRLCLKKAPKTIHCALWALVAIRLICPFSLESSFSLIPEEVANGSVVSEWTDDYIDDIDIHHPSSVYYDAAIGAGREPISDGEGGYYVVTKHDQLGEPATIENTVIPVLSWIWLAGAVALLLYAAVSYLRICSRVKISLHLRDNIWQNEQVDSPFILGVFRPRIYLPFGMDEVQMNHVVAHEQAHLSRRDHWWKPLGFILLAVYWFNPLMWVAYIMLCRDIELACDEKVMLSTKHASMAVKILALFLVAALSFFVATAHIPESGFVENALESLEDSSNTVMKFSAATLSASLAITALPDDFATPLADSLADMNIYFIAILVVLFLEKVLLQSGVKLAFAIIIPLACFLGIVAIGVKKNVLKSLAVRLCVLGLAVAFVVPCSTQFTNLVASDLTAYVEETIGETEDGANKLNEAMEGGTEEKSVFEKMSDLFQTAIHDVSDLMLHFQNNIRKCMNSIAILILTNCLMPLLTFFILKWILKETFQIAIPMPPLRMPRHEEPVPEAETVAVGE